jgi:uncharacterized protein
MNPPSSRLFGSARHVLAAVLVASGFVAVLPLLGSGQSDPPRRIEVLFLGHDSRLHPSDSAAAHLIPALAREGINFSYSTDPDVLNPRDLAHYDAIVLYANHDSISPSQEKALLDFVASGGGFLPIHSASHSFRNSAEVVALMGGQFDRHGAGTFTVPIVRPDHPVMQGLTPFETWDETYVHKNHNPENRIVLMERVEGDRVEPWTWVRTHGQGRVFYTAYGHDSRTWSQPAFHQLIRNGILWAVGDRVRDQWSRLQLPALQYRESSNIPNYERRNPPPMFQEPLSPEASMQHIQVPPGFELQLFAAEPDIVKPIAMAWDERGRLWLAETIDYPNDIHPGTPGRDRIQILEDTNGDGRADRFTVFADGLNIPTGFVFSNGGVIVAHAPDLLFLKDTNGDDRADVREVILSGWGTRDTHAGPSNLRYGFDNRIWGAVGYSAFEGVVNGENLRFGQALWRMRPDGSELEHVASFSNNTWGLGFSETFDVFGSTANNTHAVYVGIPHRFSAGVRGLPVRAGSEKIDGHYLMAPITPNVRQVDVFGGFTAAAGFNLYTARTYPREYWNRIALVSEPTGGLLHQAILEKQGAGFVERDGHNLLAAVDEWVGPVDAQVGPDGHVWVADWYNFIIQHNPTPAGFRNGPGNAYENHLRDKEHGRIFRIVYRGAPAQQPMSLSKDQPAELVRALSHDNLFWRLTAQRLLVERGQPDVVPQLIQLVRNQQVDDLGLNPGALHAVWTLEGLGLLDGSNRQATAAVTAALRHPAAGVRKAALQALPAGDATVRQIRSAGLFQDPDPHTRLAAVLRLAELPESEQIGAEVYRLGRAPDVESDPWLSQAIFVAAAQHRAGYLKAYAAEVGDAQYRAAAQRFAEEISNPPPAQPGQPPAPAPAARSGPLAERLLRAYVEDVVGPIQRPQVAAAPGASNDPVLALEMSVIEGQMKFSLPNFTVKPGQRVRLTLTNPDDMPHNLLILRPGTLEAVGALADAMVSHPDAAERQYVPPTPDVMWFTQLVDPGEEYTLEFTAPRQPGDYPYVCTFPGHWRIMVGVMQVAE